MAKRSVRSSNCTDSGFGRMSTKQIIRFFVNQAHAEFRRDIPEIQRLARRVEASCSGHVLCPVGLSDVLEQLWKDVDDHMNKEERDLFPALLCSPVVSPLNLPILCRNWEHILQHEQLQKIRAICYDFALPPDASIGWKALYESLRVLESDLTRHNLLEQKFLYRPALMRSRGAKEPARR